MDTASGLEWPEGGRQPAVAFEYPAVDPSTPSGSTPLKVPRRLRRRLTESRSAPSSVEEIEAKLRQADLRRQQFHEWLSNKARSKVRSQSWSSQDEDCGQRLEAKLSAAEQKRLSLLRKTQSRLAKLDEIRQAAKTGVEMRFEKEREELGMKVQSRIQHAETNRMLLLEACLQRRAAVQERKAQSMLKRINRENRYKDLVRAAIYQKRATAEKKRLALLEAEMKQAHGKVIQARQVAKAVCHQREIERRRMKEELEDRLQRAKRRREEYLKYRRSPSSSSRITLKEMLQMHNHGDFLSRKLARCWRQFVKLRKTTFSLAKAYEALEINEDLVRAMPFEQLAHCIESATTLETAKALLDRVESRLILSLSSHQSWPENIDHLLKLVTFPNRRIPTDKETQASEQTEKASSKELKSQKPSRYPVRVVLCSYMILGHPDAVFSGHGEMEIALADAATCFIQEFELLISIILNGQNSVNLLRRSSPDMPSILLPMQQTFRSQLAAFDASWCSFLYCFVAWKVKDARLLEEDLVRTALQLELSMIEKFKLTAEGTSHGLSHDVRPIQNQVTEDQQLLQEKVWHLNGCAGIDQLESALSNIHSKCFKVKEDGSLSTSPIANISSLILMSVHDSDASATPLTSTEKQFLVKHGDVSSGDVHSLFRGESSSPTKFDANISSRVASTVLPRGKQFMENEILVNEIVHQGNLDINVKEETKIEAKIKETMEKAFWDGVVESLMKEQPDCSRVIGLVKEVRDELCGMAPKSWRGEILDSVDLDILSQVLESRTNDVSYLGKILEYALGMLLKLSAPANEAEVKMTHEKLLAELADIASQPNEMLNNSSFVTAVVRGLRFVLEQIQVLKKEISKARIQIMEPVIRGSAGIEYLRKAFANRNGPPSAASKNLTLTTQWISSARENLLEWEEHADSLSMVTSQGLVPMTVLRSGGIIPSSNNGLSASQASTLFSRGDDVQPECKGERVDVLVRLGLLKLATRIEGLNPDVLPETLELNFLRLRNAQSQFQKIIVICTSMLILRQTLLSERPAPHATDVENVISSCAKELTELLDRELDVGIEEVVEALTGPLFEEKLQARREVMARVLSKSLQAGDAVFARVSRAVYLAVRGVVLGGSGAGGRKMAESALQRIGATILLEQVMEMAKVLVLMAVVSGQVHRPWYECLDRV